VKKKVDTNTIQCGVCGRWLRYPEGSHEVMCVCSAVLQIGAGSGAGSTKRSAADEELLRKIAEMETRCGADDTLITKLRKEIAQLKRLAESQGITNTELPEKSAAGGGAGRAGGMGQAQM
jgi:LSD1 subclass zinc finger protein